MKVFLKRTPIKFRPLTVELVIETHEEWEGITSHDVDHIEALVEHIEYAVTHAVTDE